MSNREVPPQVTVPRRQTTDTDVANLFWLFFSRKPEAEATVAERVGHPLVTIIASFLVSDEFRSKLGIVEGALSVSKPMLFGLDRKLLKWAHSIIEPSLVDDEVALDRRTVIRRLLGDEAIWDALKAADHVILPEMRALEAALADLEEGAKAVDKSAFFDKTHYRSQLDGDTRVVDLAAHYILYGEKLGLRPSFLFDAHEYARFNTDVAASSFNRLVHFEIRGRNEGRVHRHWLIDHAIPPLPSSSGRPTVLLVLHEATYTGAPILGWNLVQALSAYCDPVVILRHGGALENALRDVAAVVVSAPPYEATRDPHEMKQFAERLVETYRPLYGIANSVESSAIAVALRQCNVPIVALIHEFWPGARSDVRLDFFASCSALVFPAHVVAQSSGHAFRETRLQSRVILPQGPCAVPPFDPALPPRPFGPPFVTDDDMPVPLSALLADGRRGACPFTVIGLGAVEMRKGLDLFISTATAMKASYPDLSFRFIWIGTWEHAIGTQYAALLDEQYRRAKLGDRLHFYPAVDDLEPIYARADALYLSSRLDPLPNVTIDAAFRGIPVICFDQASGTAELLTADPGTATLVVPHLDSGAAAARIAALARDPALWASCSAAIQRLARLSFDMTNYARSLDRIGCGAARRFENDRRDQRLIDEAAAFDPAIYSPALCDLDQPEPSGAALYLDQTRHITFSSAPVFGVILRRPMAGFHPFIYGTEAPDFPQDGSRDAFAHFVEHGMPEGRWTHPVLRPDLLEMSSETAGDGASVIVSTNQHDIRQQSGAVALHGHFHYPDNIEEFIVALAANQLKADLFLTTTTDDAAEILRAATDSYQGGKVVVEVGPNIGRDVHAFLRVLLTQIQGRYEVVGHIHGKRSVHTKGFDPDYGDRWRSFLWEHLIGPRYRTANMIVDAIRQDAKLGLVFPENGSLIGWEKNETSAAALVRRLGLRQPLPSHIEFPAGTMFWARVDALKALVRANLNEDEMPLEPLPIDGTILHALERMLPLICQEAGYTYATTYIPGLSR